MKILKKDKLKILNFTTELVLSVLLLSIFSISFYFALRLNPEVKKDSDYVLGVNSRELQLIDDLDLEYTLLEADKSNLSLDIKLEGIQNEIVHDYKLIEVKNPSDEVSKYILYFDLQKDEFKNLKFVLVENNEAESIIFDSETDNPKTIDQTIEIDPKSLSRFSLRTIALSEDISPELSFNLSIKKVN